MNNKLFIPKQIKVGFQNRTDTYSGKLGYVIYRDTTGTLRKAKSWEGWRSKDIDPQDFDNTPTEGFVLNRDVGGKRHSWSSWDMRMEKVRVFDPRGFEIEISIPNLLFLLQECTSIKGKGLEGELVYSWDGKELVLLPVSSQEYKESTNFTEYQKKKFNAKDLHPGYTYRSKKMENYVYMGQYVWTGYGGASYGKLSHIFTRLTDSGAHSYFHTSTSTDFLAETITDSVAPNFSDLFAKMEKDKAFAKCASIKFEPSKNLHSGQRWLKTAGISYKGKLYVGECYYDYSWAVNSDGTYTNPMVRIDKHKITLKSEVSLNNGCLEVKRFKTPTVIECPSLRAEGIDIGSIITTNEKNDTHHVVYTY
jgi:hypothetical protein